VPPAINTLFSRKIFIILSVAVTFLSLLFSCLASALVGRTAESWFVGQIVSQVLVVTAGIIFLKKMTSESLGILSAHKRLSLDSLKFVGRFSLPLAFANIFMWVLLDAYRFLIERFIGVGYLGTLSVGLGISLSLFSVIDLLVQQAYYPVFYKNINTDDKVIREKAWKKMFETIFPIFVITAIFVTFLSKEFMIVLVHPQYHEFFGFVILGAWLNFLRIITNLFSLIGHTENKTIHLVLPYLVGALVVVPGIMFLSKNYVPLVLLLGWGLAVFIMFFQMKKLHTLKLNYKKIVLTILYSLPFALAMFFHTRTLFKAFAICGLFGMYYLFIQWRIFIVGKTENE
jgi:O-antigen/teichoic acid export membrane protein